MEILSASDKMEETVENCGHISIGKDADEKTPLLLPDTTSKEKKNEGKKEDIYNPNVVILT